MSRMTAWGIVGSGPPRRRSRSGAGGPAAAPVLTGPLDLDGATGEGGYLADVAARHYWALTAPASAPTAAEIAAGTGALDSGWFDAALGSVQADITFDSGINVVGGVFSVAARVEPSGAWSNVLRDTSVDVDTVAPITHAFVAAVENLASPNFGALAAGEYVVAVMQRAGTIDSVTPPGQSAMTSAIISATGSTTQLVKLFRVTLTAPRSGAWTIGRTGAVYTSSAIFSLSGPSQTIATPTDTIASGTKTATLTAATQADDIIIVAYEGGGTTGQTPADNGTDPVTSRAVTADALGDHKWRVLSGVAAGGAPETVCVSVIGAASKPGAIVAAVLRKV